MGQPFIVAGGNAQAPFTLKIYRGEGMCLLAMNWRNDVRPPDDFVGFCIEYKEPGGHKVYPLNNLINFLTAGKVDPIVHSTRVSPIQKFRWVHFPRNADLPGLFTYRVTPVFMNAEDKLAYGEVQEAQIELRAETYPGKLNVTFTRGFVSSQAFVRKYAKDGPISTLVAPNAARGLDFKPTHPDANKALPWMGFEAREKILAVLDEALADANAQVRVVAYDLNEPVLVSKLEQLGARLRVIIDDSADHKKKTSAETQAAKRLALSAGAGNVKRQHLDKLQHNKFIAVDGPAAKVAVCGSTNFSWRGFFVQNNNAVVVRGAPAVAPFFATFDAYWAANNDAGAFGATATANWTDLGLVGIDARATFSPHAANNAALKTIADDMKDNTTSNLLFSLAFLYQTPGAIKNAIAKIKKNDAIFVVGISDRAVHGGGLDVQTPNGNVATVYPAALSKSLPAPFKSEPSGGRGARLHHKFVVIDFDKPTARVYFGSYNFSQAADRSNGENLVAIRDQRVAVSYMIEALRIFDHYHFRVLQLTAKKKKKQIVLLRPPRKAGEKPWFDEDYTEPRKARDRQLFA
jgi:phosphatidylserine/phosphatidylglycerophosphate/cardiolipin synthase-like enzyme